MFAIERKNIIKNYLLKDNKVSVAQLSEILNVTEVTIRRDLEKLENEGFLRRTHGGAVIREDFDKESPDEVKDDLYVKERQEIAETAFQLVSDNDMIMITEGMTNVYIAKKLSSKNNLTVLTNDIRVAMEFSSSPNNNLILLGGDLYEYAAYGQLAINNMQYFSFKHLFFEVDGINKKAGLTVSSISKASLIQKALQSTEIAYAVCLSEYFGEKSLYRIGDVSITDKVITNSTLDDAYKDFLFELNIPVYTSVDIYEE